MSQEILFAICLTTLCMIIYTESSYSENLFEKSLEIIPNLQSGASNFKITMWSLYSNVGLAAATGLPIVIFLFMLDQRARAFYYIVVLNCLTLVVNVTKLYYH